MFNPGLLKEMIDAGYVNVQKHPSHSLYIYNYSAAAQYERVWNEVTLQCRGLILDERQNIIARPFKKFFNLGEEEGQFIPNEPFDVYEKMDGSLGILYWINEQPFIASRGSFISEQAQKANRLLNEKYSHTISRLDKNKTYLFEIIYPENRIVVDYGGKEELVLLAEIDKQTGAENHPADIGFPVVERYEGLKDLALLKELQQENREGFVVRFQSGLRYKIKFEEYVRIHKIITNASTLTVWENLREGKTLSELLDRVPDEFYSWVRTTRDEMMESFREIEDKAKQDFKVLENRKETAAYFLSCAYPSVLFNMLDDKNYKDTIWKIIKPAFSKPFSKHE
jgi:T4 RnlA family RNA ligase